MTDMGIAAMSDAELVAASRRGEHAAFGHLVERYQGVVCAVSYSSTGDRVLSEDVAQETFIAAWRQLDQLRETGRLRSWLCGIARNLGRKARKRRVRETPVEHPLAVSADGATPFDATSAAQAERVVRDALDRVPATYREVLVLYYREHHSAKEVADTLGITEAAVLQRLARGRQYLADGVATLVERSLESLRPRRGLSAGVLAIIPAIPRVAPTPATHGGTSMIKIAFAAAAVVATGTTAYLVHHQVTAEPGKGAVVQPAPRTASVPPPLAAQHKLGQPPPPSPDRAGLPRVSLGENGPALDDTRVIDRETIERTNLYKGPGRGPANAPVTIVVFHDMKCQFCGQVLGTIDQLWDDYAGKLRLVVKQFPVHTDAVLASEAALAAHAQGKFWELHDVMFQNQDDLSHDALIVYAQQAGLDVPAFRAALDQHLFAEALEADQATGRAIDVKATPSFVINGRQFTGALPIEQFRAAIDEALDNAAL